MDSLVEPEGDVSVPPWGPLGRDFTLGVVSLGSNIVMHFLNRLTIDGRDRLLRTVLHRETGTPLFTVCNHTSTLDDPILLGAMLPWSFFWTESQHSGTRWSLCAREVCFKHALIRHVFLNGKTLPIDRGEGVHQPVMRLVAEKAAAGDWVHIFPEAKIGYSGQLQPLKRGIGKLICDSLTPDAKEPIVLPFYHSGMGTVMPKGGRIPRAGKSVHVVVGKAVDLSDLLPRCNCNTFDQMQVWKDITERVSEALKDLERNSPQNWNQTQHKQSTATMSPSQ